MSTEPQTEQLLNNQMQAYLQSTGHHDANARIEWLVKKLAELEDTVDYLLRKSEAPSAPPIEQGPACSP